MPEQTQRERFAQHGLRLTRQRKLIYDALCATRCHPTADELYRECLNEQPGMSLATVYNTLEKLVEAGMVQKIPGAGCNGSSRYDAAIEDHLHLRDAVTGEVADVPETLGEQVIQQLSDRTLRQIESELGFSIEHVQIELIGRFAHGENA